MIKTETVAPGTMFTVSGYDPLFGQRVNCGSFLTMSEALQAIDREERFKGGFGHAIHVNPLGWGLIDYGRSVIWESLNRYYRGRK